MSRGNIGILPRPTKLADESYLEMVQSMRKILIQDFFPKVAEWGGKAHQEAGAPQDIEEIKEAYRQAPVPRAWQRGVRTQQEMMWRRTRESFFVDAEEHQKALEAAEKQAPERLIYDPNFKPPGYTRQEIHLQPGGYTDDPMGGLVFHYGTKVFYEGTNDQDELHAELASLMTKPEGKLERVLDVGCSIGQATLKLKEYNPEAEIIGLDVGLPLLRYGHMLAVERDIDVTFQQALAQDTDYEDESFDAVFSYILFHEVALDVIPQIVKEMHRILRPGGTFSIFEFPNNHGQTLEPAHRFLVNYDSLNNCEPFSIGFVECDFKGMLEEAGFDVAEGPACSNPFLQSIVATKR